MFSETQTVVVMYLTHLFISLSRSAEVYSWYPSLCQKKTSRLDLWWDELFPPLPMARLQCKANSFLVICIATSSFRFLHTPLAESWPLLAAYNLWRSLVSHSNTHADSRDIKVAYRAWDSEQQPAANRLIKCHTSRRMTRLLHSWKWLFNFLEQQSRSTYRSFGGGTLEFLYLSTKPVTMLPRPSPSESVKTDESTWPSSLLIAFVAQEAVPAVFSPSFLVTCKIVQEEWFLKHFDKYNTAMHTQKVKVPKIC